MSKPTLKKIKNLPVTIEEEADDDAYSDVHIETTILNKRAGSVFTDEQLNQVRNSATADKVTGFYILDRTFYGSTGTMWANIMVYSLSKEGKSYLGRQETDGKGRIVVNYRTIDFCCK